MLSRIEVISLIILFGGTILSAGVLNVDLSNIAWQGWMYGFLAAVTFAIFIQFNSHAVEGVTTISRMTIVSFMALITTSLFLAPEIVWNGTLFAGGLWKYGILLGLFGIIVPILLFALAAPKVGGALASILGAMELPVAVCVSVIVLHETLTMLQIVGIIIILFGIVLPTYATNRQQKAIAVATSPKNG